MAGKFNIGVVGAGYVGLVTGSCLAHVGHQITVVDRDAGRIEQLERGQVPFFEPNLEEFIARNRRQLSFTTTLSEVVREADVVFIAVDTPQGEDGSADLSSVAAGGRGIGEGLSEV